ncbi:hypothetical protein CRUP_013066 [Coryphaenoides rupestris]|nr:hypothetical protein CRUP_013066 [Coryphaenoides rupestris]
MSKPCCSDVARPKPTVRTDRDRVSRRPSTNRTAHTVNLGARDANTAAATKKETEFPFQRLFTT